MQANPVLIEVVRGNWVENIHRGAFCVCGADGSLLASAGDVARPIFPRSAIKAMQALAMFRSGAVERFGLGEEEIALAAASHLGEKRHIDGVQHFLDKIGCTVADLECGAHPPSDPAARKALKGVPTAIHNNCSGKHSGMLAVAKALDAPTEGYSRREHPVQKLVRECVEAVIGESLSTDRCGTDGCSIPTWAAPLQAFAKGFAAMAAGEGLPADLATPAKRIFAAAMKHPFLIRGSDTLDTDLMEAFGGRLMIKIGAEGVFCGALVDKGLGFALKIDDGNRNAAEVAIAALLLSIVDPTGKERTALEKYTVSVLTNWRKIETGKMQATDTVAVKL